MTIIIDPWMTETEINYLNLQLKWISHQFQFLTALVI